VSFRKGFVALGAAEPAQSITVLSEALAIDFARLAAQRFLDICGAHHGYRIQQALAVCQW
jgi:hypothetical protein